MKLDRTPEGGGGLNMLDICLSGLRVLGAWGDRRVEMDGWMNE